MKIFIIWLTATLLLFGSISFGLHSFLEKNPRKVLIAVDTSFSMGSFELQIRETYEKIVKNRTRYAEFALITEKNKIHGWLTTLKPQKMTFYAPKDFLKLTGSNKVNEIDEATEKYLITDANNDQTKRLNNWNIIILK